MCCYVVSEGLSMGTRSLTFQQNKTKKIVFINLSFYFKYKWEQMKVLAQ